MSVILSVGMFDWEGDELSLKVSTLKPEEAKKLILDPNNTIYSLNNFHLLQSLQKMQINRADIIVRRFYKIKLKTEGGVFVLINRTINPNSAENGVIFYKVTV